MIEDYDQVDKAKQWRDVFDATVDKIASGAMDADQATILHGIVNSLIKQEQKSALEKVRAEIETEMAAAGKDLGYYYANDKWDDYFEHKGRYDAYEDAIHRINAILKQPRQEQKP